MASTGISRIEGIDPAVAQKAPCAAATTANITLSGAQTIDAIAVAETTPATRVLVMHQTDGAENGVYDVKTTAWTRSEDFDGNRDVVTGTLISVVGGTASGGATYRLTTADPITIGTSLLTFVYANVSGITGTQVYASSYTAMDALPAMATGTPVTLTGAGIGDGSPNWVVTDAPYTVYPGVVRAWSNAVGNQHLRRMFSGDANLWWWDLNKDGVTDDSANFISAMNYGRAASVNIIVPYAKYYIDANLNAYRCGLIGQASEDAATTGDGGAVSTEAAWPVLIPGPNCTAFLRVGQPTDLAGELSDRSILRRFMIDMASAPIGGKGVWCDYGVYYKPIMDIWIRDSGVSTRAEAITQNKTGFDLRIATSATSGIYSVRLDNLTGFSLHRGFWTSGDSNDGMRDCEIGEIKVFNCNQGITFKDSGANTISHLGVRSTFADYDASGQTPTDWGIWMNYKQNTISNVYLEGSANLPILFTTEEHTWSHIRLLEDDQEYRQIITQGDVRVGAASRLTEGGGTMFGSNIAEHSAVGSKQGQINLLNNGDFRNWTGGSANLADATAFAYTWTSIKDGTGTLRITQRTGSSNTTSFDSSVYLGITTPQADTLYGFKQDLLSSLPISGSVLNTIGYNFKQLTVAVLCRPFSSNSAAMRVRIEIDQGAATSSENYIVDYDYGDSATQDEVIIGAAGDWQILKHTFDVNANATKCEVSFGIYQEGTTSAEIHVDHIYLAAGNSTQYGCIPPIVPPKLLNTTGIEANTSAVPANMTHTARVFDENGVEYWMYLSNVVPT